MANFLEADNDEEFLNPVLDRSENGEAPEENEEIYQKLMELTVD